MKQTAKRAAIALLAAALAAVCLGQAGYDALRPALAVTTSQSQVDALQQEYEAQQQRLNELKQNTADAQAASALVQQQVSNLQEQIGLLTASLLAVQGEMDQTRAAIDETQYQIEEQQAAIDAEWLLFKDRMAMMQELNDNGYLAILTTATNLYELLTFADTLQDISDKNTEILNEMEQHRQQLAQTKAQLEEQKLSLEQQEQQLEAQRQTLESQKGNLAQKLQEANAELSAAEAAQQAQQLVTDGSKAAADQAQAEFDAYIEAQLAAARAAAEREAAEREAAEREAQEQGGGAAQPTPEPGGNTSAGYSFVAALPYYSFVSTNFGDVDDWHSTPHKGTDFAVGGGTPIYAIADGTVRAAGWNNGGYGNYVVIYHGYNAADGHEYSSLYAHMMYTPCVSAGQWVTAGQVIGYVGSTGNSSGYHLHLELWQGTSSSSRVNCRYYVPM